VIIFYIWYSARDRKVRT